MCNLCPRNCGADRENTLGFCGVGNKLKVARAALHMWEEPCLSGYNEEGSGAIFFSGCSLGCVFCQNINISRGKAGKEITVDRLVEIFFELKSQGALNINFVTPDHYVPQIIKAIDMARERGFDLPFVYNCSGYVKPEIIDLLDGYIDIYLPDFKYMSGELAKKYSRAEDYPEYAKPGLERMVKQVGGDRMSFNDGGIMTRGVIVRHMLLPGCMEDSKRVIKYLYETYGNDIYISIMSQYTPMPGIEEKYPELAHKVDFDEYNELVDYAIELGVENGFIQEEEAAEDSFIPEFDCTGV